jgi:uncharacterized membrane protein
MDKLRLEQYGFTVNDLPRYPRVEEPVVALAWALWRAVGVKPVITSSYRSPAENQTAQGVSQSQHMLGRALDLVFPGVDPVRVIAEAERLEIPGLALQWPSGSIHIDSRSGNKARWGEKVEKSGSLTTKTHNHPLAEILALFTGQPKAGGVALGPIPIPQTTAGKVGAGAIVVVAIIAVILILLANR